MEAVGGRLRIHGGRAVVEGFAGPGGGVLGIHLSGLRTVDCIGETPRVKETRNFDAEGRGGSCPGGEGWGIQEAGFGWAASPREESESRRR